MHVKAVHILTDIYRFRGRDRADAVPAVRFQTEDILPGAKDISLRFAPAGAIDPVRLTTGIISDRALMGDHQRQHAVGQQFRP